MELVPHKSFCESKCLLKPFWKCFLMKCIRSTWEKFVESKPLWKQFCLDDIITLFSTGRTWAIGAIVTTCFFISFFFILIVCACCPCCWLASRRRHNRYVVVSNETPVAYPNSTTRTTYVYNTYPAQPNYNSTGYGQPTAPPMGAASTTTTYVKQWSSPMIWWSGVLKYY